MATYTITTNARQDAALAYVAQKAGLTVQAFVDGEVARIMRRALNEQTRDDADRMIAAYQDATPTQQQQMRAVVGL